MNSPGNFLRCMMGEASFWWLPTAWGGTCPSGARFLGRGEAGISGDWHNEKGRPGISPMALISGTADKKIFPGSLERDGGRAPGHLGGRAAFGKSC